MAVGEHLGDLQRVFLDTVSSLARGTVDDVATDRSVNEQQEAMRASAQRGDPAAVMRDLPAALAVITEALALRQSRVVRENMMMAERVESLGRALSDAEDSARTDPLTGAGNRLRYTAACERALALMTLTGAPSSLLAIELDGLSLI
jgi:GGDEF domain-containing protein